MKEDTVINVRGMHCRSCEMLLADVLCDVDGVEKAVADSRKGTVVISARTPHAVESAKKAIEKAGYRVIA